MKPGKKSSAALESVKPPATNARPTPPETLTEREAEIWREIVLSLPADWFRPSDFPLLAAYCQAAAQNEQAANELKTSKLVLTKGGVLYRNPLIAIQHAAALRMGALASKMRLCQSARYDKNKAASATAGANPTASKAPTGTPPWLAKAG
jgi:phage terminase small subunit